MFACLLFASGSAALIYQVLWIKQLSLVVGIEVYAVTTAVSAIFAGLAAGSALFGRLADRGMRPVRLYFRLELGTAITAIAATIALAHAATPFASLENSIGLLAWVPLFLIVATPAFLMGGTFPVLLRAVNPNSVNVAGAGGWLYAVNTAGAVCGALLTPFVLLPQLGVRGAAYSAAAVNIVAAAGALFLSRSIDSKPLPNETTDREIISTDARLAMLLYALAGGIALGYEVVWSQVVVQFMSTRSFAFAIVLATLLGGLVLGSGVHARFADRVRDPWGTFGALIGASGLLALLGIAGLGSWFLTFQGRSGELAYAATGSDMAAMSARFFAATIVVIFPSALFLGAAFPAALRLTVDAGHVGRDVGTVVALNTAGGILGTLGAGFVLVPAVGLLRSLEILAIGAVGLGVIAAFQGAAVWRFTRWLTIGIAGAALAITFFTPKQKLASLIPGIRSADAKLVFYEEDPGATVAVIQRGVGSTSFRRLFIAGISNSGDSLPSLRYMRLQALLPLLIHSGESRSALVIGLGTGITAGATLRFPGLDRRVCAELLPGVMRSVQLFHGNFAVGSDPKMDIHLRDGRRGLLQSSERFDVITLEPPPPSAAGVVNLYSSDFYALASRRLETNGLLAQWLPLGTQNDEDTRSLVRSFLDVFPYANLWTTELHEMLLVGSRAPIDLDFNRISARFNQPTVTEALREVGIASPAALLATYVTGRAGLERYASNALPVTDDRPRIEFASWVRRNEIVRVLPVLFSLRTEPPLRGADDAFWTEMSEERETLQLFYSAGIAAYKGDEEAWSHDIAIVMKRDGSNPYYRWIVGGEPLPVD